MKSNQNKVANVTAKGEWNVWSVFLIWLISYLKNCIIFYFILIVFFIFY